MPDDRYDVVLEELRAHAGRVEALGERLRTAADAGAQVSLGGEAYGQLCAFFVPIVQEVSAPGVAALAEGAAVLGDVAGGVRTTASAYEETERGATDSLGGGR